MQRNSPLWRTLMKISHLQCLFHHPQLFTEMPGLDNHVEHSCVLNGRSLPLVEDSPCDSDPKMAHLNKCFCFKIQIHDKSQIVSKHINGHHLAAAKTESISKSIVGMCWATSQASQKWRQTHESSSCKFITQFWRGKYRRIWTWNKHQQTAMLHKTKKKSDGVSFQTRICNYHDRLGCICM